MPRKAWVQLFIIAALAIELTDSPVAAAAPRPEFQFFWAVGCPHCADASPFVDRLEREHPRLSFSRWEVKYDAAGRRRFAKEVKRLGISDPSVPTFVCRDGYVVGFAKGATEGSLRALARDCER